MNTIFGNSKTLIKFKLKCMKLINISDNPNSKLESQNEIKKVNALITGSGNDSG